MTNNKGVKYLILTMSILVILINSVVDYHIVLRIATTVLAISLLRMIYVNRKWRYLVKNDTIYLFR